VIEEIPHSAGARSGLGLDRPGLLRGQIRALLRAGRRALRIMFPMITEVASSIRQGDVERELTICASMAALPERIDVAPWWKCRRCSISSTNC